MVSDFWLYGWIDNFGIRNYAQAERLLSDHVALADLRERAAAVQYTIEKLAVSDEPTVLAGCGLDLSGHLSCFHWDCAKEQLDTLFSHVWHYFDRIVVVGPSAHLISEEWDRAPQLPARLHTYVRLLLYIREIGAEDILVFRQKPPACETHLEEHLRETGLTTALNEAERLIPTLAAQAKIETEPHDGQIHYSFYHPDFIHNVWGQIGATSGGDLSRRITAAVVKKHLAALGSDLRAARILHCSLGATVAFQGRFLGGGNATGAEEIAFHLSLPVIDGLDVKTLLKLRDDERLHFDRFRRALAAAITERLKLRPTNDYKSVALEIRRDVLEPALQDIQLRLKTATNALAKKSAASLLLGGLSTMFGLYANPALSLGVVPAVTGVVSAAQKFIDERRDISLSEMYFLWKAVKHAS